MTLCSTCKRLYLGDRVLIMCTEGQPIDYTWKRTSSWIARVKHARPGRGPCPKYETGPRESRP